MTMASDTIEQLARRLADSLPPGLVALRDDLEKNFRSVLRTGLAKLDLVSREEFEVQESVLRRTRELLEQMEQRLAALETKPPAAKKSRQKRKKKAATKKD